MKNVEFWGSLRAKGGLRQEKVSFFGEKVRCFLGKKVNFLGGK